MSSVTEHLGFQVLGAGDQLSESSYRFTDADKRVLDRVLWKLSGKGFSGPNPTAAPNLGLDTAGGTLPASAQMYYVYTLVDTDGLETAPSPVSTISTAAPVASPGPPGLAVGTSGGRLLPGQYFYALSAYKGYNTAETKIASSAQITIVGPSSTNKVTITLPTLPAGADGFNIYRRSPGSAQYGYLGSVGLETTYVDDGIVSVDRNRTLPLSNTTTSANRVTVTIPALPAGMTWKLYRTFISGVWTNSLLHWVVEETSEGSGVIRPTWVDVGSATFATQPPATNQQLAGAAVVSVNGRTGAVTGLAEAADVLDKSATAQVKVGKLHIGAFDDAGALGTEAAEKLFVRGTDINREVVVIDTPAGQIADPFTLRVNKSVVFDITNTGGVELATVVFGGGMGGGNATIANPAGGSFLIQTGNLDNGNIVFNAAAAGELHHMFNGASKQVFSANGLVLNNAQDVSWKDTGGTPRIALRGTAGDVLALAGLGNGIAFYSVNFGAVLMSLANDGSFVVHGAATLGSGFRLPHQKDNLFDTAAQPWHQFTHPVTATDQVLVVGYNVRLDPSTGAEVKDDPALHACAWIQEPNFGGLVEWNLDVYPASGPGIAPGQNGRVFGLDFDYVTGAGALRFGNPLQATSGVTTRQPIDLAILGRAWDGATSQPCGVIFRPVLTSIGQYELQIHGQQGSDITSQRMARLVRAAGQSQFFIGPSGSEFFAYNGVTPNLTLTSKAGQTEAQPVFVVQDSGGSRFSVFPGGGLDINNLANATAGLTVWAPSAPTNDLTAWKDRTPAILSRINKAGYFMTRKTSAPADADLANSEVAFWWDPAPVTGGVRYKGKASDGTILAGSLS